jgi:hypothetical protein
MPIFTETFTNGLSRQNYAYDSDSLFTYVVSSRIGFATISDMPVSTSTVNLPVHTRMRYLHLQSTTPVNGKIVKRRVPCASIAIQDDFQALQAGTGGTPTVALDGLTFKIMGYTGEYYHKSRG